MHPTSHIWITNRNDFCSGSNCTAIPFLHSLQRFQATVFDVSLALYSPTAPSGQTMTRQKAASSSSNAMLRTNMILSIEINNRTVFVIVFFSANTYLDYFRIIYSNSWKMVVTGCETLICWRRSLLLSLVLPTTMFGLSALLYYSPPSSQSSERARACTYIVARGKTVEWMGDNKFRNRSLFIFFLPFIPI